MASVDPLVVGNSDDDSELDDWEEVDVSQPGAGNIEITLHAARTPKQKDKQKSAKGALSHAERLVRIDCHKIHTVCLLANARVRNTWINDPLLHARLLSLTPLTLQNAFAIIHKSRVPDQNQRGRLFEGAVMRLAEWWATDFFAVEPTGHIKSRTFDEVRTAIGNGMYQVNKEGVLDLDEEEEECEVVHSEKSMMKHALMRSGTRDISAQLFTALCRALGIPARLVVSLQSVPWQAGVGKPKVSYGRKGKGKGKEVVVEEEDGDMEEVDIPEVNGKGKTREGAFIGEGQRLDGGSITPKSERAKGKEKEKAPPVIKLRKTKSKGHRLGSSSTSRNPAPADPTTTAPVFWTEVFSRADARWLPVDPVRCIVNKRKAFDPTPAPASATALPAIYASFAVTPSASASGSSTPRMGPGVRSSVENRMVYVLAFEEDGYARDVTPRYAREYGAKVAKVQRTGGGGSGRREWWERVCGVVRRPYRLQRDDLEDEELQTNQMTEGMPTSIAGFKDHPLYVLSRHLKRDEVLSPSTPELGKFRGESVYARGAVVQLKTAETWMRVAGRVVKEGEQPMKLVKGRAGTVRGLRAMELAKAGDEGGTGEVMQGMYARAQTEMYVPAPVVDGKVPKNDFGNIDLYVPSMLPAGGVHIPFKGVAKIARKLGFDHAEAVTGFEFKKRRAFPVIEGVVVAAENEATLLEAYWEAEQDAEAKAREKRQERVMKRWTRLVQGLRIRQRLQEQYAEKPGEHQDGLTGPQNESVDEEKLPQAGGFLVGADDVVQAFHLPKYVHDMPPTAPVEAPPTRPIQELDVALSAEKTADPALAVHVLETIDIDDDMEEVAMAPQPEPQPRNGGLPMTMRELAEGVAWREKNVDGPLDPKNTLSPVRSIPEPLKDLPARTTRSNGTLSSGASTPSKRTRPNTKPRSSRRGSTRKRNRNESNSEAEPESNASPTKRTRAATPAAPTRVLRSRVGKSAIKVQEEKEMEEAYRRAIAE